MTDLVDVQKARTAALGRVNPDIAWHVFVHLMEHAEFEAATREERLLAEEIAWQIIYYIAGHPQWIRTPNLALTSALRMVDLAIPLGEQS